MKQILLATMIIFSSILNAQENNYCKDIGFEDVPHLESTVMYTPSSSGVIIFKNIIKNKKTFYVFRATSVSENFNTKNNNFIIHFTDKTYIKKINQDIKREKESYGYINRGKIDLTSEDLNKLRSKTISKIEVSNGSYNVKEEDSSSIKGYIKCLMDN